MMEKNFNKFCKEKECPHYIEWDCRAGVALNENLGEYTFFSCKKIGQSDNIDKFPDDCDFLEDIKKVDIEVAKQ
jgi:hypothetical protein